MYSYHARALVCEVRITCSISDRLQYKQKSENCYLPHTKTPEYDSSL